MVIPLRSLLALALIPLLIMSTLSGAFVMNTPATAKDSNSNYVIDQPTTVDGSDTPRTAPIAILAASDYRNSLLRSETILSHTTFDTSNHAENDVIVQPNSPPKAENNAEEDLALSNGDIFRAQQQNQTVTFE